MVDCNKFEPLRALDDVVLAEIVKEGEARLAAQLQIATAADQRALTVVGFQIASATAALAGGVALMSAAKPDYLLAVLAIVFAGSVLFAAFHAIKSVKPTKFHIIGNKPSAWLPDNWMGGPSKGFKLKQARIEQAACLDEQIADNALLAEAAGGALSRSIDWSLRTVAVAGGALMLVLLFRAASGSHQGPPATSPTVSLTITSKAAVSEHKGEVLKASPSPAPSPSIEAGPAKRELGKPPAGRQKTGDARPGSSNKGDAAGLEPTSSKA